jgi:ABC-type polysaccharide/polyol phosphate transport system ATPase subunit
VAGAGVSAAPVVVEVRDLRKAFRIPDERVDSLKERVTRPFHRPGSRVLQALDGVSFDVHDGEFFGIVGRNGSGKSTLLKCLAGIYGTDGGRIRMAGRLAPFIELGVGFNPELTSRENVVLNGVLMGLTRREARRRLDAVLDFAELREFVDLKLKNYSSGMMVRLAFSVMVEADADIMLIDEVLAVGDAAFAAKCMDVFRAKRAAGRTIVLVTHDMTTVQALCDRAMLLHDAEVQYAGDPEEAALRYFRLNFAGEGEGLPREDGGVPDVHVRVLDAHLSDPSGARVEHVEQGVPFGLHVTVEARRELVDPVFGLHFLNGDGQTVFGMNLTLPEGVDRLQSGQRATLSGTIDNVLLPGRFSVRTWISRNRAQGDLALHALRLLDFTVFGTQPGPGDVAVRADMQVRVG